MFIIKNEIQFDMAHFLTGYEGKCANIHGHRYRLIVKFSAEELHTEGHKRGMVEDFSIIKPVLREIETYFDHKLVIEDNERGRELAKSLDSFEILFVPYRPTVEEMSRHIYYMLRDKGLPIMEVELFETHTNSCIYKEF